MKIIGIDPGLTKTGWGIIEVNKNNLLQFIACGTIYSKATETIDKRLKHFYKELSLVIELYRPEFSAISSWRLAITATIETLDRSLQGATIPSAKVQFADIMKRLPDE